MISVWSATLLLSNCRLKCTIKELKSIRTFVWIKETENCPSCLTNNSGALLFLFSRAYFTKTLNSQVHSPTLNDCVLRIHHHNSPTWSFELIAVHTFLLRHFTHKLSDWLSVGHHTVHASEKVNRAVSNQVLICITSRISYEQSTRQQIHTPTQTPH